MTDNFQSPVFSGRVSRFAMRDTLSNRERAAGRNRAARQRASGERGRRPPPEEAIIHLYDYTARKKWQHPRGGPERTRVACPSRTRYLFCETCKTPERERKRERESLWTIRRSPLKSSYWLWPRFSSFWTPIVLGHAYAHGNDKYLHCPRHWPKLGVRWLAFCAASET